MATYEEWNGALLGYTLNGVPKNTRIYLSIDDETIAWIADDLKTTSEDFLAVIRLRCVSNGIVSLNRIYADKHKNYNVPPRYFAFLCAMVLAAHHMGENEETNSPHDYFTHFNGILGLTVSGRPPGLEGGREQDLWNDWAFWLRYNGYQPTATKKNDQHYTYARSQALLRGVDKDRLWRHFGSNINRYAGRYGKGELTAQLRADAKLTTTHFPKHLRDLLETEGKVGSTRHDDLADALHETFDSWIENGRPRDRAKTRQITIPSTIRAGLYRTEDYLSGEINYFLLPRQPRHIQTKDAFVFYQDEAYPLISNRVGWFEPLPFPILLTDMENTVTLLVQGIEQIQTLSVPTENFWILPPDPEDVTSGVYASWTERPELGVPFVLLCKSQLKGDMELLKRESLINWSNDTEFNGWIEYSGVMVLSDVWTGISLEYKELASQLRPRTYVGIALRGGLRDKNSGAWLVGYGPEIIVNAFAKQASMIISDLDDDMNVIILDSCKTGEVVSLQWTRAGDYAIRVQAEDQTCERFVHIIDWSEIRIPAIEKSIHIQIDDSTITGAFIEAST